VVDSGIDAVERAGITRPSVIVLDLGMWELSGYEALPLIKARCPGAAIIIYSAALQPVDHAEAKARGADAVVPKTTAAVQLPDLAIATLAAKNPT
jgi:CheY-like chemotaxis protein